MYIIQDNQIRKLEVIPLYSQPVKEIPCEEEPVQEKNDYLDQLYKMKEELQREREQLEKVKLENETLIQRDKLERIRQSEREYKRHSYSSITFVCQIILFLLIVMVLIFIVLRTRENTSSVTSQ